MVTLNNTRSGTNAAYPHKCLHLFWLINQTTVFCFVFFTCFYIEADSCNGSSSAAAYMFHIMKHSEQAYSLSLIGRDTD